MKRKFTFLSAALMLLTFLAVPLGMWGQSIYTIGWGTATGDEGTYTNFTATSGEVAGVLSFITEKNSSQTAPAYNSNASELRLYYASNGNGGSITISPVSGITITDAVMTTSTSPSVAYYVDGGSAVSVSASNNTYTISGISASTSLKIQNVNTSNTQLRIKTIALTYTTDGTQPTTYTVTYHANVTGIDDVVDTYNEGANVTLRAANTFTNEGYTFEEWNTDATGDGDAYEAGYQIEGIDEDLEFYAIWTENTTPGGDEQWVLTSLADLTENDVFVIVGNNGSNYAMSNSNGTGSAPAAVAVTIANDVITGTVADNIQWTISGETDNYIFYPNGSTETWLYCTSSNNGVRVGTNNANTFKMEASSGYLVHQGTSRYIGIYSSQDWRCYTTINNNIANQTFAFYKKVTGGIVPPSITANNVEIAYDATGGSIAYTINNGVEGGSLSASTTSDWLILGDDFTSPIAFTCSANEANTARTATVTLTYTYDTDQTVTKDVTITQAAAPVIYTTIPELFAAATSTETSVLVTFNNWVVSGVYSNGKSVLVTDNNGNGFVIYYSSDMSDTYAAGDILSGTAVTCTLKLYNGFAELLNVNVDDLTITEGGTVSVANIEMANLAGVNTGALVHYDNLTCTIDNNKYYLTDGTTTIQLYNAIYAFSSTFEADHIYNITGVYQQYNSTKEILPRSADDIEEVVIAEPSITLNTSVSVPAEGGLDIIPVEYVNIDDTQYPELLYYNENQEQVEASYYEEWITLNFDNDDNVQYNCDPNTNVETRSIYFKVLAHDYDNNEVTSDLVTITQDAYVAPASITVNPDMVEATAAGGDGTLSIILNNMTISTDTQLNVVYCYENGEFITNLDDMPNWLECIIMEDNEAYVVYYSVGENLGTEAQTAYFKVYGLDDNGTTEAYSNLVTITQEAGETPVAESWVLTDIADLTEGDVFVIVGTDADDDTFALPNNATSAAPAATSITVANGMLATEPDDVLKWNISGNATDGYIFYPNGDTENWLYCTNTNNGVRVGTNDAKVFSLDEETGYLKHNGTGRYIGVYNSQDWRCYTNTTGNIADQTIAFYKKVGEPQPSITVNPDVVDAPAAGKEGTLSITLSNMTISDDERLDIVYYYATGEQITNQEDIPNWLECIITEDNDAYVVYYSIGQNMNTEAQTAYFKVYGIDDDGTTEAYSNLVTITQEAAPQLYDLTVEPFENLEIITFVNDEMVMEADGTIQVTEGAQVMLSIVADEGYVIETLMVNGVDHAADIAEDFTYTFEMPAEAVTISATAVEAPTPVGGDYVRITSLDQLTDGSKVIIAARYDEEHTNGYYAMENTTSGKPTGVAFTSEASGDDEILPEDIISSEDTYYWTVNVTNDGYTFTNANNQKIGYSSGTNFATGGNNIVWTITRETADEGAMVAEYEGFVIRNGNTNNRAFAFNGTAFGAYATSNMNNSTYNFYLDFFVQSEAPVTETYTLHVNGYGDSEDGYVLLASPVSADPANTGMITDDGTDEENLTYDFYYFDQSQDLEWMNYRKQTFNLVPGKGYLYANKNDVDLTFTGTPYSGDGQIALTYDENAEFAGWNLVGNPFGVEAKISMDYYALTPNVTELIPTDTSTYVASMQGVFVQYTNEAQTVIFTPVEVTDVVTSAKSNDAKVVLNVTHNRGNVIDRAIIRFGEGRQLSKFQLNPNHTKVYFPQGENDYAIVRSANEGEMPVNFKAENNGTYTFSVNTENVEMTYLHLIDNMTGADVDLLANPSYSFEAKTTDYASRFRLVFNANMVNENGNETFAYFNGSEWVVSNMGEATLQVVDMLGRIVSSETVNGNYEKSLNVAPGVYMIRLINGNDVKVQKMIVK